MQNDYSQFEQRKRDRIQLALVPANQSNVSLFSNLGIAQLIDTPHSDIQRLGRVYNSSFQGLRSAACPRDLEILNKTQFCCINSDPTGSRGQAAGRRKLNCKHALIDALKAKALIIHCNPLHECIQKETACL